MLAGLQLQHLRRDFISGITVGIVAIPLGMAFAMASGVKPEYGIYTTIIAGLIVSLLGGSRFQIAGPTGAFIPILLAVVLQYGYENLLIAGFMAGTFLVLMSFLRIGNLVHYIPRSVTIGFTTGIAVIIFTGQLGNLFGLNGMAQKQYFHENMLEFFQHLPTLNLYSLGIASIGIVSIVLIPKIAPRVPVLLVALLLPTFVSILFFPSQLDTIGTVFGGISQSLPTFHLPNITWTKINQLWGPAFAIASLGAIESLLSAVVADGMTKEKHHSNRELFGQGIANMITPLFGGIPATGAIARTATNIKSGAATRLSGVIHSIFVLLTLLLFAPYASHIPLAAMAPILMYVAWNMSQIKTFKALLKRKNSDSLVLVVTFLLTVFVNLTVAIPIGLLLAVLSFVKKKSELLQLQQEESFQQKSLDDNWSIHYKIFTIKGPLFFGTAQTFEQAIAHKLAGNPKTLIIDMTDVSLIDATGEEKFTIFVTTAQQNGYTILIAGLPNWGIELFQQSGLFDQLGMDAFFSDVDHAKQVVLEAS
ncbi:sodium-independent anion transporter [Lederbergia ruris]|uniref:Sodium-independent anion transporter n=1 Tax=Lederbergia ruris TaxID=217495 RepID=A0ABQ4KHX6_9BACI|nr:SulP family inorganic anion transporter [Lederbergia ruris]GIN56953.1 sodium-independent anion transporter [Lederbergia ruris]